MESHPTSQRPSWPTVGLDPARYQLVGGNGRKVHRRQVDAYMLVRPNAACTRKIGHTIVNTGRHAVVSIFLHGFATDYVSRYSGDEAGVARHLKADLASDPSLAHSGSIDRGFLNYEMARHARTTSSAIRRRGLCGSCTAHAETGMISRPAEITPAGGWRFAGRRELKM